MPVRPDRRRTRARRATHSGATRSPRSARDRPERSGRSRCSPRRAALGWRHGHAAEPPQSRHPGAARASGSRDRTSMSRRERLRCARTRARTKGAVRGGADRRSRAVRRTRSRDVRAPASLPGRAGPSARRKSAPRDSFREPFRPWAAAIDSRAGRHAGWSTRDHSLPHAAPRRDARSASVHLARRAHAPPSGRGFARRSAPESSLARYP